MRHTSGCIIFAVMLCSGNEISQKRVLTGDLRITLDTEDDGNDAEQMMSLREVYPENICVKVKCCCKKKENQKKKCRR